MARKTGLWSNYLQSQMVTRTLSNLILGQPGVRLSTLQSLSVGYITHNTS